jgi:hypothetical protein
MQIFALTPHFWRSSFVHNPGTLLDCLPQAEVDKITLLALQTIYCFEKNSRAGRDLLYFQPTLAIFSLFYSINGRR